MTPVDQDRILKAHMALPESCRYSRATPEALAEFEAEFSEIPADYRWYLSTCGGGVVGSEWLDDVARLKKSHLKFKKEGWSMKDVFVIGWDGGGNPLAIDRASGRVLVEDHDLGGVHVLATSFADFVFPKKG